MQHLCPFCYSEHELISHCFFHYSFACILWNLIEQKLDVHFSCFPTWHEGDCLNVGGQMGEILGHSLELSLSLFYGDRGELRMNYF